MNISFDVTRQAAARRLVQSMNFLQQAFQEAFDLEMRRTKSGLRYITTKGHFDTSLILQGGKIEFVIVFPDTPSDTTHGAAAALMGTVLVFFEREHSKDVQYRAERSNLSDLPTLRKWGEFSLSKIAKNKVAHPGVLSSRARTLKGVPMPSTSTATKTAPTPPASTTVPSDYSTISTPEGRKLFIESEVLMSAVKLYKAGKPLALLGPPGAAKTDLGRALMHAALHSGRVKEIYQAEYGGIVSGDQLDGERTLDEHSRLTILPSEWLKAVRSAAKGVPVAILHDEHNRASTSGVNKQLRSFSHNEFVSDLDGVLAWDPVNLLHISTLNVGFEFGGTNKLDAAFADRMYPFIINNPPEEIVELILDDRYPTIDAADKRGIVLAYSTSHRSEDAYKLSVRDVLKISDGVIIGGLKLRNAVSRLIGGMVALNGLPEEAVESLITAVAASTKS